MFTSLFSAAPVYDKKWVQGVLRQSNAKTLLSQHPDQKDFKMSKDHALMYAIKSGKLDMVQTICESTPGAELLNRPGENKQTPIAEALFQGNLPILIYLLNRPGIDVKPIQGKLGKTFQWILYSCIRGIVSPDTLIAFLKAPIQFDFPAIAPPHKLYLYSQPSLLEAVLSKNPPPLHLLDNIDAHDSNMLIKAINEQKLDVVKIILANPVCREAFLESKLHGKTPLQLSLLDPDRSLEITLELIKAGADVSPADQEMLTDFTKNTVPLDQFKSYWKIRAACLDTKVSKGGKASLDEEDEKYFGPSPEKTPPTASDIITSLFGFAQANLSSGSDVALDDEARKTIKLALGTGQPDVRPITDVYRQEVAVQRSANEAKSYGLLYLFLNIDPKEWSNFFPSFDPLTLAKLYYQPVEKGGPTLTFSIVKKDEFIKLATPYVGFLLLVQHFQNKFEIDEFRDTTRKKMGDLCNILYYFLIKWTENHKYHQKKNYERYLSRLSSHSSQHDYPTMLAALNKCTMDELRQYALHADKVIREHHGPLKVTYLKIMDEIGRNLFDYTKNKFDFDVFYVDSIFAIKNLNEIYSILKMAHPTQHTWLTYAVARDNQEMLVALTRNINEAEKGQRAGVLGGLLNLKGKDNRTPIEEALHCGNLPILGILLNTNGIIPGAKIIKNLPDIISQALRECRAGSLAEADLIRLLKTPCEFTLGELSQRDKLYIYTHPAVLQAVLDRKPPEINALKNLGPSGHNILTQSIVQGEHKITKMILEKPAYAKALMNERVGRGQNTALELLASSFCLQPKNNQLITSLLALDPKMSEETYDILTSAANFDYQDFKGYETVRDACNSTTAGAQYKSLRREESATKKKELLDIIFKYLNQKTLTPKTAEIDLKSFDCKEGSIKEIHFLRFPQGGELGMPVYFFTQLPPAQWHDLLRLLEPKSLAKLLFQRIDRYFPPSLDKLGKLKAPLVDAISQYTGFLLLYNYFNLQMMDEAYQFSKDSAKNIKVVCEIIYYLLTKAKTPKDYLNYVKQFNSMFAEANFATLLDGMHQLALTGQGFQKLKDFAQSFQVFMHETSLADPFKEIYMKEMGKLKIKDDKFAEKEISMLGATPAAKPPTLRHRPSSEDEDL